MIKANQNKRRSSEMSYRTQIQLQTQKNISAETTYTRIYVNNPNEAKTYLTTSGSDSGCTNLAGSSTQTFQTILWTCFQRLEPRHAKYARGYWRSLSTLGIIVHTPDAPVLNRSVIALDGGRFVGSWSQHSWTSPPTRSFSFKKAGSPGRPPSRTKNITELSFFFWLNGILPVRICVVYTD